MKIRKGSKIRTWSFYASNDAAEFLAKLSFYREEVKAFFPGCRIVGDRVYLAEGTR